MAGQQEPPPPPLPGGMPASSGGSSSSSSGSAAPGTSSSSSATGSSGAAATPPSTFDAQRGARFVSMANENINRLRKEAARYDKMAGRERHRSAKLITSMEKHRHTATRLREKEQAALGKLPDLEAQMNEHQKLMQSQASQVATGEVRSSDQSKISVKIRKIQARMAGLQRRAKNYEHAAARHLQIASQKKVEADMHLEKAKQWEAESQAYTLLADRTAKATEPETIAPTLGH